MPYDKDRPMRPYTVHSTVTGSFKDGKRTIAIQECYARSPEEAALGTVLDPAANYQPFTVTEGHHRPVWEANEEGLRKLGEAADAHRHNNITVNTVPVTTEFQA